MLSDLRFALRMLRRAPGFALVAIATLALGIGANTAIFSLIDNVFLHGLPFARSRELVRVYNEAPERNLRGMPMSLNRFQYFRDHQTVFSGLAADFSSAPTLTGLGDPEQLSADQTTSNYFELLGVTPIKGRLFRSDEESTGDHVAILSERFWTRRFDRDPNVCGRTLVLDGVPHVVVGVVPDQPLAFFGPTDLYTTRPFEWPGLTPEMRERGFSYLRVIARLPPGTAPERARQGLAALADGYHADNGSKSDANFKAVVADLEDDTFGGVRQPLWLLLGAVGFVLLIATSNAANLLLVRFTARRRETAIRSALGADVGRVVRLFLIESLMVSFAAAMVGAGLAYGGLRLLTSSAVGFPLPVGRDIGLNGFVLVFTIGVALLVGLLIGLYPSLQAARQSVARVLNEGGRSYTPTRSQHRVRMALLVGQVALSFVLLTATFLMLSSLLKIEREPVGFDADATMATAITLPTVRYATLPVQLQFADQVLERARRTPGVTHAAIGVGIPLAGYGLAGPYARADASNLPPANQRPFAPMRFVTSDYFATLGIRLLAGREFTDDDRTDSPLVVVISASAAKALFPEGHAVGRQMIVGALNQTVEVVGVAADVRSNGLAQPPPVEIYRPLPQCTGSGTFFQLVVRGHGSDPTPLSAGIRAAVQDSDKTLPVAQLTRMREFVEGAAGGLRLMSLLLGTFATMALVLAAVGLYGVVAYLVSQRTTEIGVRLALGADPGRMARLVFRLGLVPVAIGIVLGGVGAVWLGRLLQSELFNTTPLDPGSYAATAASLALAALVACATPARRAMRVDPATALRE